MWRRGANLEGDAANFIETEQLLELKDFRSSFLQVFMSNQYLAYFFKQMCSIFCFALQLQTPPVLID